MWFQWRSGCAFDAPVGFPIMRINPEYATPISVTYAQYGSYARLKTIIKEWAGDWIFSSRYSWSWLIKQCVEVEQWKRGEASINAVRIHLVHSKLKSALEKLRMYECRCALLFWLNRPLSNVWNFEMSSRRWWRYVGGWSKFTVITLDINKDRTGAL